MRGLAGIDLVLLDQRGHLFPWAPVFLALGIGAYFSLMQEPGPATYAALSALGAATGAAALRWPGGLAALGWAVTLAVAGFCIAGARAHRIAAPVLEWRYYGPVEGRVVGLDRSASDAVRVTLDRVRLDRVDASRLPGRVRLSLHGGDRPRLQPGQLVMTTAHLAPPQGPVEPGGFDFRRHAWFQGLGAVGYTRVPVLSLAPPGTGRGGLRIFALRMAVSQHIRDRVPGEAGGFAAAVTTGDRSAVHRETLDALRASNLAHLLAISGLHMGLLAGFVFASARLIFSTLPYIALRIPTKKIAAVAALFASAGYLLLSGGNVATERAFVMVAVMLCALLFDRRAISLRGVAVAALIVLALRPEALLGPGFQMSFAATTALVAVFGWLRDADLPQLPRWARVPAGVALSSAVAGLATAPIGAAHFNTISHFGLLANILSVPLMGLVVIPAAVAALCLAPFGLDRIGLWVMGRALDWILAVAHRVAALEGAQGFVVSPGPMVLPLLAAGILVLILWQGRARFAGLVPAVLAFAIWTQGERPAILVADNGALVGVMTEKGRALSKPRGSGFVAENWLENDGDGAIQARAAGRWPTPEGRIRQISLGSARVVHLIGKRGAAGFTECKPGEIVVVSVASDLKGGCDVYDAIRLQRTGSVAIDKAGRVTTARQAAGRRLWNAAAHRRSGADQ